MGNKLYDWKMNPRCLRRRLASSSASAHIGAFASERERAGRRRQNTAEDRKQRRLAAPGWPHQQGEFARKKGNTDIVQGENLAVSFAQFFDDPAGFKNWNPDHRANTMAGSILVTLKIEESAEMAHIATVAAKSSSASCGVNTIGIGEC